jgi:putative redox protein
MVIAEMDGPAYATRVGNGRAQLHADVCKNGVGGEGGFRPHELLEAALAACLSITLRMAAREHDIACDGIVVRVDVRRDVAGETRFCSRIDFPPAMPEAERRFLLHAAGRCPVRTTLSQTLRFQ